jgi:antitoxin ParD1/3/4
MEEQAVAAMNVSLTPELDRFVREAVGDGRYASSSEVVREALRLLQDRQRHEALKLEALRADIAHGIASGAATPLDMAAIKARARAVFATGNIPG